MFLLCCFLVFFFGLRVFLGEFLLWSVVELMCSFWCVRFLLGLEVVSTALFSRTIRAVYCRLLVWVFFGLGVLFWRLV